MNKDIFESEIIDFSKEFFDYLPNQHEWFDSETKKYKEQMIEMLNTCEDTQHLFNMLEQIHENDYFPYMRFIDHDEYIYKNQKENYDAPTQFLQIATFGKGLETFFFSLFEKLIREKFSKFQIAKVLMLNRSY